MLFINFLSAYNKDEQRLVIVAINDKSKKRQLSLDLGEFSPEDTCEVIRTSGSLENGEHWTRLTEKKLEGSVLSSSLMPYSITTFILTSKN